jgi:hypothetical protein
MAMGDVTRPGSSRTSREEGPRISSQRVSGQGPAGARPPQLTTFGLDPACVPSQQANEGRGFPRPSNCDQTRRNNETRSRRCSGRGQRPGRARDDTNSRESAGSGSGCSIGSGPGGWAKSRMFPLQPWTSAALLDQPPRNSRCPGLSSSTAAADLTFAKPKSEGVHDGAPPLIMHVLNPPEDELDRPHRLVNRTHGGDTPALRQPPFRPGPTTP